jgi:RNA polymerase sigma-70 factor (ECF subfamily)
MDNAELKSLLESHHNDSYGWAMNCCSRDPGRAESVLQSVYLKVLQGKARFDGKSAFRTWLFAVIRTTAANDRRWQILRNLRFEGFDDTTVEMASAENVDRSVYQSELQKLFHQALATLPRRQREVLQLVFYHDLTLAEAAEVMQVSLGSVRMHYDRGKKQIRQWLMKAKVFDETEFEDGLGRRAHTGIVR